MKLLQIFTVPLFFFSLCFALSGASYAYEPQKSKKSLSTKAVTSFVDEDAAGEGASYEGKTNTETATQDTVIQGAKSDRPCEQLRQFTFSWSFKDVCDMEPRGGTTRGASVTLDPEPHPGWLSLKNQKLSDFERDRRAILAMSGPYRTSFDFLEVIGYTENFKPDKPYQSWATEYVYVVEDLDDFISLQHIMVMTFVNDDGTESEPFVMKHWRQDWQYEPKTLQEYSGKSIWTSRKISRQSRKGRWSQSVYQVDDSPRYAAMGAWEHNDAFSTWQSDITWRPLPRRESSVRDDYDVLEGRNRHTIVPNGWVHEEENYKVVLDKDKNVVSKKYLSKELGLNRYERIINHDFSPGDRYWEISSEFWRDVRLAWSLFEKQHAKLKVEKIVDGIPLFIPFFEYANMLEGKDYQRDDAEQFIRDVLDNYVSSVN